MSTVESKDTEEAQVVQRSDSSKILVKTRQKGKAAQVHHVRLKAPEVNKGHSGLVTRALFGRVKKDYDPVKDIRKGLPVSSVLHMATSLRAAESDLLPIIGMSDRTLQRRRKENKPLDPVESDRLYRLAKVYARAIDVFENEEVALDWLKARNRALGDVPVMLLDTEAGTGMVERVLTRIEHGIYS